MFAMMRASMPVMRVEFMNRVAYAVTKYDDCLDGAEGQPTPTRRARTPRSARVMGRTLDRDGRRRSTPATACSSSRCSCRGTSTALEPVLAGLVHEIVDRFAKRAVGRHRRGLHRAVPGPGDGAPDGHSAEGPSAVPALGDRHHRLPEGLAKGSNPRRGAPPVPRCRSSASAARIRRTTSSRSSSPARVDGEGLTDDEVVSFLRLLIPAGAETTFKLLGNLFVALLSERERATSACAPTAR